jgi:Rod binding domain-containing protein
VSQLDISAATASADGGAQALQGIAAAAKGKRDPGQLEKVAKDFESVFLEKITDEMRRTVPQSGLLDSSAMDQTQGIFWMQLSQELAKQGGLGLWKQLVKQMQASSGQTAPSAAPEVTP